MRELLAQLALQWPQALAAFVGGLSAALVNRIELRRLIRRHERERHHLSPAVTKEVHT